MVNSEKDILHIAQERFEELLKRGSSSPKDFPPEMGVYLIRTEKDGIIYVGKAKKLHRRINDDHISGELKITTSTFRNSIAKKLNIPPGPKMRQWVIKNCTFSFIEVDDSDMCHLVEALTIAILRKNGARLLNS